MAIIINKPGVDINGRSYPYLKIDITPEIELHYDRVFIKTKCFNGTDISNEIENPEFIIPEKWDRFDPIVVPYEEAAQNLSSWAHQKVLEELSSEKNIPYEYMAYEDDVYDLDPSTGEQILDPSTGTPIKLHKKGELIKKKNGTYMFYTKILPRFCEEEDIKII